MTGWLKLTDEQRAASILEAEYVSVTAMRAKVIEKDWWVTLVLRCLFQGNYGQYIVFKGGTSLSKCWKLISRFSEDIDIALSPTAFGMDYQKNPSKGHVDKLKRAGCAFTSNQLKNDLEQQLSSVGVPPGMVSIFPDAVPADRPDTDPQTLHMTYPSLFDRNPYLNDEVKIEVSVRSLQTPSQAASIQSMLSEANPSPSYAESPFQVEAVVPKKTFLEKVFLLHEEFGKTEQKRIRSERMSRHLYDIASMMDTNVELDALADKDLYFDLINHRKSYQRISWVNYETLKHKTIAFIPPLDVLDLYEKDYQTMREQMISGPSLPFPELIGKLETLQGKFRSYEEV